VHLEKNLYHCWLCDKKGTNVTSIVRKYKPSLVPESIKLFKSNKSKKQDFDLFDIVNQLNYSSIDNLDIEKDIVDLPKDFQLLANNFNSVNPDIRDCFKYLIERGINKHKMWFLKVGVSNSYDFNRSIILPSFDENGKLNYYTARKIDASSSDAFKYKNASVKKKNIIFNELNIDWNIPLTIVEGPLDLLKTNDNATCLLGSSLTQDMLLFEKIVQNKTEINLALDKDVYSKTMFISSMLSEYDVKVNIVDTRSAEDVGDMTISEFEEHLKNAKTFYKEDKLLRKISLL
jgi:hypothetical protein